MSQSKLFQVGSLLKLQQRWPLVIPWGVVVREYPLSQTYNPWNPLRARTVVLDEVRFWLPQTRGERECRSGYFSGSGSFVFWTTFFPQTKLVAVTKRKKTDVKYADRHNFVSRLDDVSGTQPHCMITWTWVGLTTVNKGGGLCDSVRVILVNFGLLIFF